MTNSTIQRLNMIECQIKPCDVTDQRLLRALADVPRENYLPPSERSLAYLDMDQPLVFPGQKSPSKRYLLAPRTLAKLIQLAKIEPTHYVLDVGCGTGYVAAILSRLCQTVIAMETDEVLAQIATQNLTSKEYENVTVVVRSLKEGYPERGAFDRILLEGSVSGPPDTLLHQLKDGGCLIGILRGGHGGRAHIWLRRGASISTYADFDITEVRDLPGFEAPKKFVF